MQPEGAV